jgi:hypothetical protein
MNRPAMLCIGMLAAANAAAADRKFEPVPQSSLQHLQVVNGMTIVSASGQKLGAGASIPSSNAKKAWLSVSVKNTGKAPVGFTDSAIVVTSGGEKLNFRRAGDVPGKSAGDGLDRDKCAQATSTSQVNCNIDSFNAKQARRLAAEEQAEPEQLGVGQLVARQYQVDLPRKAKRQAVSLNIAITVDGEEIVFVFMQAD